MTIVNMRLLLSEVFDELRMNEEIPSERQRLERERALVTSPFVWFGRKCFVLFLLLAAGLLESGELVNVTENRPKRVRENKSSESSELLI